MQPADSRRELNVDKLVAGWIQHTCGSADSRSNDWAFDLMCHLESREPETCWLVILRLIARCPNDRVLSNIAAGPLESLIARHGPDFIDRILAQAKNDPQFRKCLRGVWPQGKNNTPVWKRIEDAVRGVPRWCR